jgi:hypothetical protein
MPVPETQYQLLESMSDAAACARNLLVHNTGGRPSL